MQVDESDHAFTKLKHAAFGPNNVVNWSAQILAQEIEIEKITVNMEWLLTHSKPAMCHSPCYACLLTAEETAAVRLVCAKNCESAAVHNIPDHGIKIDAANILQRASLRGLGTLTLCF